MTTDYSALLLAVARALELPVAEEAPIGRDGIWLQCNGKWNPATSDADSADLLDRMVRAKWNVSYECCEPDYLHNFKFWQSNGCDEEGWLIQGQHGRDRNRDRRIAILLAAAQALGVGEVDG
jgi:hypothetical protein